MINIKNKINNIFKIDKKSDIYCKFFIIFYFLVSLYLILINLVRTNITQKISSLIALILIIILPILIKKIKIKTNIKLILIIAILFPIIIRILLLFLNYYNIGGDYGFLLNGARNYSMGNELSNEYISLFPYVFSYMSIVGSFMKITSTNYIVVVLLNLIFDLVIALLIYLIAKKYKNQKFAVKTLLFYLYNPISILWITRSCPVVIVNMLITLLIYLFLKIDLKNKYILFSILTGIAMGLLNYFRPIAIIFLITLFIYYLYLFFQKYSIKKICISFSLITIFFITIFRLGLIFTSETINIDVKKPQSGFTLLVGSNYEADGAWNEQDSILFFELVDNYGRIKGPEKAKDIAINRYIDLGLKNIKFMIYKSKILSNGIDVYSYNGTITSIKNKIPIILNKILEFYTSIFFYVIILLNFKSSTMFLERKKLTKYDIIPIFGMGLFFSMLLVEVSPRYFMPILIPLIFTCCYSFEYLKYKRTKYN